MALLYQTNGNLAPGIHEITWEEFNIEVGFTAHRRELIKGLAQAISDLRICGCTSIFIDGSFVTKKPMPNDYDACWTPLGVDFKILFNNYPIFFDFANSRQNQMKKYKGEFFPTTFIAIPYPRELYIDFFRHDKDGNPKGIVLLRI